MIEPVKILNPNYTWIDVLEPQDEELKLLHSNFNLPQLLVQDCLRPEHLPKYESSTEGHFLMLRSFDVNSSEESITVQEITRKIALFITDNRVITIHRVELPYIKKLQDKFIKSDVSKSFEGLIHQLVLATIRSYEDPLNKLQDQYDEFEADILAKRSEVISMTKMYLFRRRLFVMKRMIKQTEEALYQFREFWDEHPSMIQDLRENCNQIYYRLDEISDTFEHLFQLYISLNDQRANQVMKILTVFSTVLLPLNFLASFYGMNFSNLPGLNNPYSVHLLLLVMILIGIGAIWYFNYRGWFRSNKE